MDKVSLARQRIAIVRKQLADELPEDPEALCRHLRGAAILLDVAAAKLEGGEACTKREASTCG